MLCRIIAIVVAGSFIAACGSSAPGDSEPDGGGGSGGGDGGIDAGPPPRCFADSEPTPPPDLDAAPQPLPEHGHQWPAGCAPFPFTPDPPATATGFVKLGDESWDLSFGAAGPTIVDDSFMLDEVVYSRTYNGTHITLLSGAGCDFAISVTLLDDGGHALPHDYEIGATVCPAELGVVLHPIAVSVLRNGECMTVPESGTGTLSLSRADELTGVAGHLVTTVSSPGGPPTSLELSFDLPPADIIMGVHTSQLGLCKPRDP